MRLSQYVLTGIKVCVVHPGRFCFVYRVDDAAMSPWVKEIIMSSNVGGIDRFARIIIGLVLIGLTLNGNIGVWGWLGIVPLATGAIGWCPPYAMFGFSTCAMKKKT